MDKVSKNTVSRRSNRSDSSHTSANSIQTPKLKGREQKQALQEAKTKLSDHILQAASTAKAGVNVLGKLAQSDLKKADRKEALSMAWERALSEQDPKQVCVIAAVAFTELSSIVPAFYLTLHNQLDQWPPVDAAVLCAKLEHLRSEAGIGVRFGPARDRMVSLAVESASTPKDLDAVLAKLKHRTFGPPLQDALLRLIWKSFPTSNTDLTVHAASKLFELVPPGDASTRQSLQHLPRAAFETHDHEAQLSLMGAIARLADGRHDVLAAQLRTGMAAFESEMRVATSVASTSAPSPSE